MTALPVTLSTDDGLTLEGLYEAPASGSDAESKPAATRRPMPSVIPCTDSMRAPFLDTVAAELVAGGLGVLRFNTRGTGASEGSFGGGVGETLDLAAAWSHAGRGADCVVDAKRYLAGWSFGARLAMAHAATSAARCVAFAPPVRDSLGDLPNLELPAGPTLYVIGDRDQYTSPESLEAVTGAAPLVLRGCDHFFVGGFGAPPAKAVAGFFATVIT